MSTTLTGEPQPMANGKASHSDRVGDALAPRSGMPAKNPTRLALEIL